MKQELPLTYALKDGVMVSIDAVERGLECGCACPKCKQPLEAKKGEIRQRHFAHLGEKDGYKPCHGYYMTALHKLAEQIIQDKKQLMFPAYEVLSPRSKHFNQVECETRNDRSDLQPDLVGIDQEGIRWMIEIRNSHEVDERKAAKIKEIGANCLEIDVREQTLDDLESFLLKSCENRKWINAPQCESMIKDRRTKALQLVAQHISEVSVWLLPGHFDVQGFAVQFQNVTIVNDEYLTAQDSQGQDYQIYVVGKSYKHLDYSRRSYQKNVAVLELVCLTEMDEPLNINSLKSQHWYHFPDTGIVHDRYIESYIDLLRTKYKGLVGKTNESCSRCNLRRDYKRCEYVLQDITYRSEIYHLCLLDWYLAQEENEKAERKKREEERLAQERKMLEEERLVREANEHPLKDLPETAPQELIEFSKGIKRYGRFQDGSIIKDCRWYSTSSKEYVICLLHETDSSSVDSDPFHFHVTRVRVTNGDLTYDEKTYYFDFQAKDDFSKNCQ